MRSHDPSDTDVEFNPRPARIAQVLLVLAGVLGSVWLFDNVREQERVEAERTFDLAAYGQIAEIDRTIRAGLDQLQALAALFASSDVVEEDEFRTFIGDFRGRHLALRAFAWIDPASARDGSFRARYREGDEGYAVPVELGAQPELAAALRQCNGTGSIVLSLPTSSVVPATEGNGRRVLAAMAVHGRDKSPAGIVAALIDVERLLDIAVPDRGVFCQAFVEDVTAAEAALLAGAPVLSDFQHAKNHHYGNRVWRVTCTTGTGYLEARVTWMPWLALFGGLAATALLLTAVVTAAGRVQVGRLAKRRTLEVQQAYGTLAQEAQERLWAVATTRQLEKQLREIIDLVPNMIYVKDWYGRFLLVNEATAKAYGTTVDQMTSAREGELGVDPNAEETLEEERSLMKAGLSSVVQAMPFIDSDGSRRILCTVKIPCVFGNEERAMLCVSTDITEQRHAEHILTAQNRILSELARGVDAHRVLNELVNSAEEIVPGMRCSVLLLDPDGCHLRHGSAPSLPAFYNEAIDGLEIGEKVGSCGAAAHSGERFVVEDVMIHPNWEPYRDIAKRTNIRACWSEPIRSAEGEILGTFAMYYAEPRRPEAFEEKLIESMAHLAGLAIERSRVETKQG